MKLIRLFWVMQRLRVTYVLVLFYSFGLIWSGHFYLSLANVLGALAIIFSYGSATSFNDLSDFEADKLNLKEAGDRPLANMAATKRDIIIIGASSAMIALVCGFAASPYAGLFIVGAFLINIGYSLPPLRVSYHAHLVPFYLTIGYVILPFLTGVAIWLTPSSWRGSYLLLLCLYLMFVARINLKDFRDRVGDEAVGKPTMLVKHGKDFVISLSMASLSAGVVVVCIATFTNVILTTAMIIVYACVMYMLTKLRSVQKVQNEVSIIALGARLGNIIVIVALLPYLARQYPAPAGTLEVFAIILSIVAIWQAYDYTRNPHRYHLTGGAKLQQYPNKTAAKK